MKKHILIAQSLMLMSLGSTPSLFSMMEPTKNEHTSEQLEMAMEQVFKELTNKKESKSLSQSAEIQALDREIASLDNQIADLDLLLVPIIIEEKTVYLTMPNRSKEKEELFSEVHQHLQLLNPMTLKKRDRKTEKKELFNGVHQLLQNPIILKNIEQPGAAQLAPIEDWVERCEQFQKVLHNITSDAAPLKKTAEITPIQTVKEREYWLENHNTYQNILNQLTTTKISFKTPEISSPDFAQSMMVVPMPKKKGIESWLYLYSGSTKPHHIIYYALENGYFDLENETHLEYLETAFDTFIEEKNSKCVLAMLEICQYAAGKMEISERITRKAHNFLESITAQQEEEATLMLQEKNAEYIKQSNALIVAFQEEMTKRTKELHEKLDGYNKDCNDSFTKKADYMRNLKTGTIITHTLTPQLKLGKDENCSDAIHCLRSKITKNKTYMTQEDVNAVYSNARLLNKIELDKPMAAIQKNSEYLLAHISAINNATQNVKLLT